VVVQIGQLKATLILAEAVLHRYAAYRANLAQSKMAKPVMLP
jgi:hypothetical protein